MIFKRLVPLMGGVILLTSGCSVWQDIEDTLWPSSDDTFAQPAADAMRSDPLPPQGEMPVVAPPPPPRLGTSTFTPQPPTPGPVTGTFAGSRVVQLRTDLTNLQAAIASHNTELQRLRSLLSEHAAGYHGITAAISARLQVGTTPGNPILTQQWNEAQRLLEFLGNDIANLNSLSNRVSADAAMIGFLGESADAAYGLSGAIEEDHIQLNVLADDINRTAVLVERLLNELSDDIQRESEYVSRERRNLTTLSLAVKRGDLLGRSLANITADAKANNAAPAPSLSGATSFGPSSIRGREALVVIRFDRDDVDYQEALYTAMSRVLERQPDATFDLVAVSPVRGSPSQMALDARGARRNAEGVLRVLSDMGLSADQVSLSASSSTDIDANEVRIYFR